MSTELLVKCKRQPSPDPFEAELGKSCEEESWGHNNEMLRSARPLLGQEEAGMLLPCRTTQPGGEGDRGDKGGGTHEHDMDWLGT